jgi:hypothetical protein
MDKIKNLLQQVTIIQKKYDDLAEYSGEHYNVFDILGVRNDELSHSSILTNLLNAKGRHGQKDLFLKLFIETVKNAFENSELKMQLLNNFNTGNSKAEKEKFAGKVNYEAEQGGRIDIVINDGKNNIIIENKVYAGDQPLQLVRYNEYDKNAPILYLTLDGKEASENSKGNLRCGNEYVCISYQIEIVTWLEKSIKEMANKPIIRETLNQYLFLIKSLTNQANNNKMSEEINKIVLNDKLCFDSFIQIVKIRNSIKSEVLKKTLPILLNEISNINNLTLNWNQNKICSNSTVQYSDFYFSSDKLAKNNLIFNFQFQGKDHKDLIFGFTFIDQKTKLLFDNNEIHKDFNTAYGISKSSDAWLCYKSYDNYIDWNDLNVLQRINFGEFETNLKEKISLLAEILSKQNN